MKIASRVWWFLVAMFDWRTLWRQIRGQPIVDVVFISNLRDEVDRDRSFGNRYPAEGHVNGPRYWFGNVAARIRVIDSTPKDLATSAGRKKAKEQFVSATGWAREHGARVVLLAAGTKRLFGEQASELKALFPDILFTIGDSGTTWLLRAETLRALHSAGLMPGASRVCVIGPTGFLGESVTELLVEHGYDVVGLCNSPDGVEKCGIEAYSSFKEIGKVDAVVACTHADGVSLSPKTIGILRREGKRLLLVDPSEPANLRRSKYEECRDVVIRQDAGNAYSAKLEYVLGAVSYKMLRMTKGVVFGCFAEALVLASALLKSDIAVLRHDWFAVSEENRQVVGELFRVNGFSIPSARCFGKPVTSFDLGISRPSHRAASALTETS